MDRPWYKSYDLGIPHSIAYPHIPVHRLLEDAAPRYPHRTATMFLGARLTFAQLDRLANRFANALAALGVRKGDRVALLLPNCPQFVIAWFGILKLGAVVVASNPLWVEREVEEQLRDSGAETILVYSRRYPLIKNVQARTNLKRVIVTNIKDYFPLLTRILYTLSREKKEGDRQTLDPGDFDFRQLLRGYPDASPSIEVLPSDVAMLQYTGGTTGTSKGAIITHFGLICNTWQNKVWFEIPDGQRTFLAVIPFFHVYGMVACMAVAIATASTLLIQPRFAVRDVLRAVHTHKPDYFLGVPTMFVAICNDPTVERYNLRSLRFCVSGAAPLHPDVKARFERLAGVRICEGYGLSEVPTATHCAPYHGTDKPGSIGLPFPDIDCKIVDVDTGNRELAIGETGELCLKAPQTMVGYWNRPEETALVLRDGWLYTGDIARMDEDGYFYIVDRKKDMIISGGFNVYPREVEDILATHPKVKEVAVIGIPDVKWGEAVKAFVVLKEGDTATAEEIIAFCKKNLARYMVPAAVEFRTSLPKTVIGKVLRRILAEEERAKSTGQGSTTP